VSTSVNAERITNDTTIGADIIRMDGAPARAAPGAPEAGADGEPVGGAWDGVRSVKEAGF